MKEHDEPIIEVKDLTIGWGDVVIQKGLSFDVKRGEIFGVLGGSGSGKSTLLRFMTGLEEPLEGDIDIAGRGRIDLDEGLPPFGVMFQAGALFGSMTLRENVALPLQEWTKLPREAIDAIALSKLRLVGLAGAAEKFPNELSGGMKKRAGIARALALEPPIVFLDEPSAGLDPISARRLDELIVQLRDSMGTTVVIVSHELASILGIGDASIFLDTATRTISASGPPRALLAHPPHERIREFLTRAGSFDAAGGAHE